MQQQQQASYQPPPQPTPQFVPQATPQFAPQTMQPGMGSYAAQTGNYNQPSYNQVPPLSLHLICAETLRWQVPPRHSNKRHSTCAVCFNAPRAMHAGLLEW